MVFAVAWQRNVLKTLRVVIEYTQEENQQVIVALVANAMKMAVDQEVHIQSTHHSAIVYGYRLPSCNRPTVNGHNPFANVSAMSLTKFDLPLMASVYLFRHEFLTFRRTVWMGSYV
ncbi:hypothetical protein [uncultured Rubinisphaera sp.]|uniref:hypothetical protein n=1 Tax=uncultured Rubinisphaera sp. TaxID=1678686 RepID=UPI0030D748CC|tara:strand:+ start:2308 stop:2655 length:348 start_codon:yes stop_codon:yes gene_type:complete